jgi:transmembrane sensor
MNKRIQELLLKCLQGIAEEHEYEESYKWIHANSENFQYYKSLRDAWLGAGIVKRKNEYDCRKAWKKVARKTKIKWIDIGFNRISPGWKQVAAVFLIAFLSGNFLHHILTSNNKYSESEYVVKAPIGSRAYLVLPDNSEVWLNAGSTLRYSAGYGKEHRNLKLDGEAYFDVNNDQSVPFRVQVRDIVVHALGTSFNIKAYPEEDVVETLLVTGRAKIERIKQDGVKEEIILRPNQRLAIFRPETGFSEQEEVDKKVEYGAPKAEIEAIKESVYVENIVNHKVYTSWKEGELLFQRERMSDLVVRLGRLYDVKFTFQDDELKNYHLTGSLEQETLEQVLYAIRLIVPMDFSIKHKNVILKMNYELKEKYEKTLNQSQ